ncbi:unnamed protein product [Discosporangium mesarthrocarpum]
MCPLKIDTGEFGKRWIAFTGESRATGLQGGKWAQSPAGVAKRLGEDMGTHTVEVIPHTSEGICAGELGQGGQACLVHCKVWPEQALVDITVRAPVSSLSDAVLAFARNTLVQ